MVSEVRLTFDRGTLIVDRVPPDVDAGTLPDVRWDARVGGWRARACAHAAIVEELPRRGLDVDDRVRAAGRAGAGIGGWPAPPLRPYQDDALTAWELGGHRGVVVLPTGAGKTRVAIAAIAAMRAPALVLVPTRVLLHQWTTALREAGVARIGVLGDGERQIEPTTVATYESAWRMIEHIGGRFGMLVVDEVHHFAGGARTEILEACTASRRLGLTATPVTDDDQLARLIGPAVFVLGIRALQGSFLAELEVVTLGIELTRDEREQYQTLMEPFVELTRQLRRTIPNARFEEILRVASGSREGRAAVEGLRRARALCAYPERKRAALRRLLDRTRQQRTLVFTGDNASAYAVAREHLVMPMTCDIGRKEREAALARFRDGALCCLVSAQVLNEGLDVPDATERPGFHQMARLEHRGHAKLDEICALAKSSQQK